MARLNWITTYHHSWFDFSPLASTWQRIIKERDNEGHKIRRQLIDGKRYFIKVIL